MQLNEFRCWLDGFEHAFKSRHPTVSQWKLIKSKLEELDAEAVELLSEDLIELGELAPVDSDVMENLCQWLGTSLSQSGAKPVETSISQYDGHVIFDLDGHQYVAAIRPIIKSGAAA